MNMNTLDSAKEIIREAESLHRDYTATKAAVNEYLALPWWKRIMTTRPEMPEMNYFRSECIKSSYGVRVEVRVYYTNSRREVSIAINEGRHGYSMDVRTGEKSPLLGSRGWNISSETEAYMDAIRRELTDVLD